ncbi:MAG: SDR family oxidoreductase [Tateyamaria sp.]|uniref:SDR family oxidoreductase n=1 Tax=Roseobacteraceae TaxID=2854170 RepID=UPI0032968D41
MHKAPEQVRSQKTVLVLGAYGLIGACVARHLMDRGYDVRGMGRDLRMAQQVLPGLDWVMRDMADMTSTDNWADVLQGVTDVVNCSGALQDGPRDNLQAVHHHAIAALAQACATGDINLVQISAVGVNAQADTAFMATKAFGDAAVRASGCQYRLFRPGLVLAPQAYGGTALLRMLAAIPLVQPIALANAQIQTVSVADVARAVEAGIDGRVPPGFEGDLVEDAPHNLSDLVATLRGWLGFAPARWQLRLPGWSVSVVAQGADFLSRLGWRSPLRSTALRVLQDGVRGDPGAWRALELGAVRPLTGTLQSMPARTEDRLAARMSLLMPLVIAVLAVFWALSGAIGLVRANTAAQVLEQVGWPHGIAVASVVFWALVDLGLAALILMRRYAKAACWGMIGVSLFYLVASTLSVPHMWLDPLGPLVKILPSMVLALVARVLLESR